MKSEFLERDRPLMRGFARVFGYLAIAAGANGVLGAVLSAGRHLYLLVLGCVLLLIGVAFLRVTRDPSEERSKVVRQAEEDGNH